ncbi:phosphodiesterase [Amylibacter sp.]|nr:phosphodiesterase [Amylibacter sp.]
MTTILQISDTHIIPKGSLVSNVLDTSASLKKLVIRINEIRPQIENIDCVLVSGDISDDGSIDSYERFKSILAPLQLPIYVIPGNHDIRENMRKAFLENGLFQKDGPLNWHKKTGSVNLIGLDTLIEGQGGGTLLPESLGFLKKIINNLKSEPIIIALHHPPFKTDIKFMDTIGLKNIDALKNILRHYKGEIRIVCGHIHCMMITNLNNHIAISAPSPCSTFSYDTRSNAPIGFMSIEDGCLLHNWNNGFKSIRIGLSSGTGPFPF